MKNERANGETVAQAKQALAGAERDGYITYVRDRGTQAVRAFEAFGRRNNINAAARAARAHAARFGVAHLHAIGTGGIVVAAYPGTQLVPFGAAR